MDFFASVTESVMADRRFGRSAASVSSRGSASNGIGSRTSMFGNRDSRSTIGARTPFPWVGPKRSTFQSGPRCARCEATSSTRSRSMPISTYPQKSSVRRPVTGAKGWRYGTTAHGRNSFGAHHSERRSRSGSLTASTVSLLRHVRSKVQAMWPENRSRDRASKSSWITVTNGPAPHPPPIRGRGSCRCSRHHR